MIVYESKPITLVGGGDLRKEDVNRAIHIGSFVVAADSGADSAIQFNVTPRKVIGDFDSLSNETRKSLTKAQLHLIEEQDSTDFDKCLRNIKAPLILGVGFLGRRIDHQLAALNCLARYPDKRCVLLGSHDVVFLLPPAFQIDLAVGAAVSLFPIGAVEGHSEGLRWPIAGLNFTPDGQIGTSNEASGPISLSMTAPKMLMSLPAEYFEAVADTLMKTNAHWPAH